MKLIPSFDFVRAAAVRRAVVPEGDIREDIAYQNEINALLARFDGASLPLTALDWIREPVVALQERLTGTVLPALSLRVINSGDRFPRIHNQLMIDRAPPKRAAGRV